MICVICKEGNTAEGTVTVTLTRGESTIIIKDVPAEVCANCGEYYLSEQTASRIYDIAEQAVRKGVEIEILKWVA